MIILSNIKSGNVCLVCVQTPQSNIRSLAWPCVAAIVHGCEWCVCGLASACLSLQKMKHARCIFPVSLYEEVLQRVG